MGVLEALKSTAQAMSGAKTLKDAMEVLLDTICRQTEADACSIFILDAKKEDFLLVASTRSKYLLPGQCRIPHDEGLVGAVASHAEPIRLDNAASDPRNIELTPLGSEKDYQAFLGVPLIHAGEVLGVVVAQNGTQRVFSEGDEAFVVTLSAQLSGAIAQALESGRIVDMIASYGKHKSLKLQGVGASSGVAMGEAVVALPQADFSMVFERASEDISADLEKFDKALESVRKDIRSMDAELAETLGEDERALFGAYLKILDSKSFTQAVIEKVTAGQWVQSALKNVVSKNAKVFEEMSDEYLKERATDIWDLGRRVLSYLQSLDQGRRHYAPNTILMGSEITASMLAEVPKKQLKAVVSIKGSVNSHVAILANALGIPAVMGVEFLPLELLSGRSVIVDGYTGRVFTDPHQGLQKVYRRLLDEEQELQENLRELIHESSQTQDEVHISLKANVGLIADIDSALTHGAEGVGLYRSEVPFMVRDRFPGDEEQRIIYRQFLESFHPKMVIMRALDIGGDKDLPYFQFEEDNPYLGWRGIRILLDHPEIFAQQIRAMLKAAVHLNNLQIMLPMVSRLDEIIRAKELIWAVYQEELAEGTPVVWPKIGVMIEVPSLIQVIDEVLDLVDFVSIGTNDLTQYMLAVDRNNPRVEDYYDSFDPGVLRAIAKVVSRADFYGKSCGLCGEMAGDPLATILLIGLGFVELSMSASKLLRVKWIVRGVSVESCKTIAQKALLLDSSEEVRALLAEALREFGFGSLIRAGKP
jgi:phosphotransferase system enzyme I (PtsP)